MEVHPHTHTPRKKWHHYFWEFFMMFLAVFCGFLAENFREYSLEHKRERKLMGSLLLDLDKDSAILRRFEKRLSDQEKGLDSLMDALRRPLSDKRNIAGLYVMYMKYGQTMQNISFSENAISQLKFGNGLRLIREDKVIASFNDYEAVKKILLIDADEVRKLVLNIEQQQANRIFDFTGPSAIFKMTEVPSFYSNNDSLMNVAMNDPLVLCEHSGEKLVLLRNSIRSTKALVHDFWRFIFSGLEINRNLYNTIHKEYPFI